MVTAQNFGTIISFTNYPQNLFQQPKGKETLGEFHSAFEKLFKEIRDEKQANLQINGNKGGEDEFEDAILKPFQYYVFDRSFDFCIVTASRSVNTALHRIRRHDLLNANPKGSKLEKSHLNKHIIWGENVMYSDSPYNSKLDGDNLDCFCHSLDSNSLIAFIHIKLRAEFMLGGLEDESENNKVIFEYFLEQLRETYKTYVEVDNNGNERSITDPKRFETQPYFIQLGQGYSEITLILPCKSFHEPLDFSESIRKITHKPIRDWYPDGAPNAEIPIAYSTMTTLGVKAKQLESFDDKIGIDDHRKLDISMAFTHRSEYDTSGFIKKRNESEKDGLNELFEKKNSEKKNENNYSYQITLTEGKTDIQCQFCDITANQYVKKLSDVFKWERRKEVSKIRTEVGKKFCLTSDNYIASKLCSGVSEKFTFSVSQINEVSETLYRIQTPYSVQQYIINIFNSFNNFIEDEYEYFQYIDLYDFLESCRKHIVHYATSAKFNSKFTIEEFVIGKGDLFEGIGLSDLYSTIRLAFENRMYSSYYLSHEVSELNLMYSGASIGRITTLNWLYRSFSNLIKGKENSEVGDFLLVSNHQTITVSHGRSEFQKVSILRSNFNYLYKIENILPVILAEIDWPVDPLGELMSDELVLSKLSFKIVSSQLDNSELEVDFFDSIHKNILRGKFLRHVVKDYATLVILFGGNSNAFVYWNCGIALTDRKYYHFKDGKLKIKKLMLYDLILRYYFVVALHGKGKLDLQPDLDFPFKNSDYLDKSVEVKKIEEYAINFIKRFFKSKKGKAWKNEVVADIDNHKKRVEEDAILKNAVKLIKSYLIHFYSEGDLLKGILERDSDGNRIKYASESYRKIIFDPTGQVSYPQSTQKSLFQRSNEIVYELRFLALQKKAQYLKNRLSN